MKATYEDILDKNIEGLETQMGYLKRLIQYGYLKTASYTIKDIKLAADKIERCLTELMNV